MTSSRLESLPLECLEEICGQLAQTYQPSVFTFALVSKKLYLAATSVLFHTVKIDVRYRTKLIETIEQLPPAMYRHIRHLIITGSMARRLQDTPENMLKSGRFYRPIEADRAPLGVVYEEDEAWMPLASLIGKLPGLTDLTYQCSNQFSPCLLRELHDNQSPKCRLHIEKFQLVSLQNPEPDSHEVALATSPNLTSICTDWGVVNIDGSPDYSQEAMWEMLSGLAPNLQKVSVRYVSNPWNQTSGVIPENPCKSLKLPGRDARHHDGQSVAILRELSINRTSTTFPQFAAAIDLSVLRVLELLSIETETMVEFIAGVYTLPSLEQLSFSLPSLIRDESPTDNDEIVCQFLRSFSPLRYLSMKGYVTRATWDTMLEHHSQGLQTLHIHVLEKNVECVVFGQQDIQRISDTCLHLKELSINIPRSRGDVNEVAMYRAFGSIKKLRCLYLDLDASNIAFQWAYKEEGGAGGTGVWESAIEPTFDEFDTEFYPFELGFTGRKIRHGHVKNTIANGALDKKLALAIAQVISLNKPAASTPFEKLQVCSVHGGMFRKLPIRELYSQYDQESIDQVFKCISGTYIVDRRHPRDDDPGEWIVTAKPNRSKQGMNDLNEHAERIFRRLWPAKAGAQGSWYDHWSSFPLHEDSILHPTEQ
jgi:hypothetical protein